MASSPRSHSSHWGAFDAVVVDDDVVGVRPYALDADPSPLLGNIAGMVRHPSRIAQPMVRAGWLEHGPGATDRFGFVTVDLRRDLFVTVRDPRGDCPDPNFDILGGEIRIVTP